MYIAEVPNRNSPPSFLLRESYRENGKVKNRTLANLSALPRQTIELLRRVLRGESLLPADQALRVTRSLPHGHVQAVFEMIRHLGLDTLLASRPCRQRDLVLAMIVQRILHPSSKLAATRLWNTSSLAEELAVADADVDELYEALDWLLERQRRIENKLAQRHLSEGVRVLYDVSSSSYFGRTCPLARFGYNRDGRADLPCIVYGVMTDAEGRPLALDVYPGGTADPATVPDQVQKLRKRFGLKRVVLVGDRGMLTQTQIDTLREQPGLGWLSALRSEAIRKLIDQGRLERSLFDQRNLAEIGVKVGQVLNRHKVGKHFTLSIDESSFHWQRRQAAIDEEAALDGIYVIRSSEPATDLSSADAVRNYKRLADVEQAFRTLKGMELMVRPIHHRADDRVRAHLLICLLAYYVHWHLKQAWTPLLFADEHLAEHRARRDPVKQAEPAKEVRRKKVQRQTAEGLPLHSFRTLLAELATQCRQTCQFGEGTSAIEVRKITEPTPLQIEAFRLLRAACSQ